MSKDKPIVAKFFTELDAILDTRFGTALRIDPDCTGRLVKAGYFERDRDQFPGIDKDQFNELYARRDRQTLRASMATPIMQYIRDFIKQSFEMNIETPFLREPKIVINLYPYVLTSEEQDAIKSALISRTNKMAEISFVNMKPSDITPTWLKPDINIVAMYNPYDWLEKLAELKIWDNDICPSVMMISPLRIRDLSLKEIDMTQFQKDMELLASPFIDLQLLPIRVFSADVFPPTESQEPVKEGPIETPE